MQLNKPGEKICKCKFANVCKRRIELERVTAHDCRDTACLAFTKSLSSVETRHALSLRPTPYCPA